MKKNSPQFSEKLTRKELIDGELTDAGWRIISERDFDASRPLRTYDRCAIGEYPTDRGPADYALCADGKILGIVEAKKLTLGPQNVLSQAERYAMGLTGKCSSFRGYGVPFLYATNGEVIWHHDVRHELNRSRQITHFHTPDALAELLARDFDALCHKLAQTPNDHALIRPYQQQANAAIEEAIESGKRQMLVAMATGTGKTFTLVNQIYRLMKAGVARRVLFLVDRRALAAQALKQFASFDAEPGYKFHQVYEVYHQRFHREDFDADEKFDPKVLPKGYLKNPKPGNAFVYVSTIQRMTINLLGRNVIPELGKEEIEEDVEQEPLPIHAFDLIIADECHRGYTAKETAIWRNALEHFDAIKIGLTATPAAHTTSYFKEVVYRYEYERAVREGFLVDYDVVAIKSNVRMQGVFLKEGEQVSVVDPETGNKKLDEMEDERQFDSAEVEEKVTSPDSNRKILEEVKKYALEHEEQYGRLPKILIFAVNDLPHTSHADQLVDIARDVFGRGDAFVQKITGSPTVDRPLQRIREFRNRTEPGIAVTVDMLSTGVDIPDLEYIVFLRPVKSRILFEQMLGRGTRKGEHYSDKSHFVVFDCFDGTLIEYFRNATAITAEPPQKEARTIADHPGHLGEPRPGVFYEIEQLVSLATHRNFDRNLNNAVVESNLLHLRNLRNFFNHSAREKDEVLASDYGFPHSPIDIPRKYSERLNKGLAHITYSRVSRSEADKAWPYDLVIFPVLSRCGSFIRHLIANRSTYGKYGADLWRQLVERIEALPSPSDPASMNLSAATSSVQVNVRESFK